MFFHNKILDIKILDTGYFNIKTAKSQTANLTFWLKYNIK